MVLLIVLTIAPLAILLVVHNLTNQRDALARIYGGTTAMGLKLASYPKEVLPAPRDFLLTLSQLPEMAAPENCEPLLAVTNPVLRVQPYFSSFAVFTPDGNRVCPAPLPDEPINLLDRDYFQRVLQKKEYTISTLLMARMAKKPALIFSRPVLSANGDIRYVVNLGLDAEWLQTLLNRAAEQYPVPAGTTAQIVDDAGTIIAAIPQAGAPVGMKVLDWNAVRPLLTDHEDVVRQEAWRDGILRATAYVPLLVAPEGSLRLRVGTPIRPAMQQAIWEDARLFSITAGVILLAILLAWLVSTRMVLRPIHAIWLAATALKGGNLAARVGPVNATGELAELASAFDSMAEQIQEEQQRLQVLATHDSLTGLPNRYGIREKLSQMIEDEQQAQGSVGVILLDLDGFKQINDSYGHPLGDKVLIRAAGALFSSLCDGATAGRLGGDEFIILVEGRAKRQDFVKLAVKVQEILRNPIDVDGHEFLISASMGIAIFPEHGSDIDTLIQHADVAMYHAKATRLPGYCFYSCEMNESAAAKLRMQNLLKNAIEKGELVLYYQPKISASTCRITGAEALVRWNSAELGMVSPVEFIPLAEETGLIVAIGEWVLKTACAQLEQWNRVFTGHFSMAVNLSPRQFADSALIPKIIDIARTHEISISQLELEITEGALMHDPVTATEALHKIRAVGAKVAVDDFGTGYSSLGYLKRLPIDALKVDRSFVSGLPDDGSDRAIVSAVIAIAQELNLRVTVEGVETIEQLNKLRKLGCDELQGYLFSRPVPAEEFTALLRPHGNVAILAPDANRTKH
ncbi:bifunctional diguanylate cyclase/phosphodiesterase [Noviherbaspirillum pedocola]|uniref:EAL domain-containing protein n=1 Tax=Noviherbaspirillum pedocola TaxID=2801341 RepID=A0A934SWL6_9BURK|nr:EAL domain-containing protein [Noviherbaspirillum pedocola]MBK4737925.1 EAL domain-containing protein [Noviherbaspirillum pedocola]